MAVWAWSLSSLRADYVVFGTAWGRVPNDQALTVLSVKFVNICKKWTLAYSQHSKYVLATLLDQPCGLICPSYASPQARFIAQHAL